MGEWGKINDERVILKMFYMHYNVRMEYFRRGEGKGKCGVDARKNGVRFARGVERVMFNRFKVSYKLLLCNIIQKQSVDVCKIPLFFTNSIFLLVTIRRLNKAQKPYLRLPG